MSTKIRCSWANSNDLMMDYHDTEYGFEVTDDNVIFERLMLEVYQAGLTWNLVLKKRKGFNKAFHNYDIVKVSKMTDGSLEKLRSNPEIIRNRLKINATKHNALTALKLIQKHGSFLNYLQKLPHTYEKLEELKPCIKQMKKDGFKFIGPLILEEFFMSIGMHTVKHSKECFLYD